MNKNERLTYLLEQVQKGSASPGEYKELREWIDADQSGEIIQQVHAFHTEGVEIPAYDFTYWSKAVKEILQVDKIKEADAPYSGGKEMLQAPRVYFLRRYRVAVAVLLLMLGAATYFVMNRSHQKDIVGTEHSKPENEDVTAPTGSHAVLTLANGQKIIIDSIENGAIVTQGATQVIKLADGQIIYDATAAMENDMQYNTLAVPRGGKPVQLQLPDGSKVWLNSASSIIYPVAFTGKERKVEISGEVYFEVAKNASKKFFVSGNGIITEVLGTHFNINVYEDDVDKRITLLEGSIKVSYQSATAILKPGQQAYVESQGNMKVANNIDAEAVMAWKNGIFLMDKADIATIMRQVARWYDVEIEYRGNVPKGRISGDIPRDMNLSKVLKVMELSGVHFKIDNKKVIVMP